MTSQEPQEINIWLDDERDPSDYSLYKYTWVKSVGEVIRLIEKHGMANINRLSLDHDLGPSGTPPGYDVLLWIEQKVGMDKQTPPIHMYAHSANPSARQKMKAAIRKIYDLAAENRSNPDDGETP